MKEKYILCHTKLCAFKMVDFETSSSKSEVSKSNSRKITSFSKTMALQREPSLTMFYTINLSPLLVTKKGFMPIIILSNYQWCPLHCWPDYRFWPGHSFVNSDHLTKNHVLHFIFISFILGFSFANGHTQNVQTVLPFAT